MNIGLIGTVGVPACYGGFETLAENLVRYSTRNNLPHRLTVYCSAAAYEKRPAFFEGARLQYVWLGANGWQSMIYDAVCLLDGCLRRHDVVVLLGVSGALFLPIVRLISRARIITNVDGIEWRRGKWSRLARLVLRLSERCAVRWSHAIVADNQAISEYIRLSYGKDCQVIAYGGDHALDAAPGSRLVVDLPANYALALCRIEPENNVAMILEGFSRVPHRILVFVGNWQASDYGKNLREKYDGYSHIFMCDPVYDVRQLREIRERAWLYVHGHSAGGTNPSLVEMMHFGIPVLAHGCDFNRYTTECSALYFNSAYELCDAVETLSPNEARMVGKKMRDIAVCRYTWAEVGHSYFSLIENG
ncbi:MAG: DUF1972 domain-containing protein [Haliea sp.]|uniref:DUF1972 domain-containing protein n=1 Tax=Haliea sp. TaxID=1932666 RepID=UPI0032ED55B6